MLNCLILYLQFILVVVLCFVRTIMVNHTGFTNVQRCSLHIRSWKDTCVSFEVSYIPWGSDTMPYEGLCNNHNSTCYLHAGQNIGAVSHLEPVLLEFFPCRVNSFPLFFWSKILIKLPCFSSNVTVATLEPRSTLGNLEPPHILQLKIYLSASTLKSYLLPKKKLF